MAKKKGKKLEDGIYTTRKNFGDIFCKSKCSPIFATRLKHNGVLDR